MRATYLYHSFPRRSGGDPYSRGLSILKEIVDHGLLLTPEKVVFREMLENGTLGRETWLLQKRICFTELAPEELRAHAGTFGAFALEWEVKSLRCLGAIPVFYVPLVSTIETLEGIGAMLLCRLGEAQDVLARLEQLKEAIRSAAGRNELLNVMVNGRLERTTNCTVQAASDLMAYLEQGVQPVDQLVAAIRALCGFICPTENLTYTDALGYYRQHEWRIIANMNRLGARVTSEVSADAIKRLRAIDEEFFMRVMQFPTGEHTRASQSQYLPMYLGRPIHETVRRIICPSAAVDTVCGLLAENNIATEVVSLETVA